MKLAIITGADGGMGYEETKAVAEKGYQVIMACFCPKKAEQKCEKLKEETLYLITPLASEELSKLLKIYNLKFIYIF